MSKENALFQQVKEDIAFDTLWPQVEETVATLSGDIWTDTEDHDPGMTLLQAAAWNTSDLSYRTSLSLNDLLTQQDEPNLFPADFGPQGVLTCNAITAEDYRHLLRDLTCHELLPDYPEQDFIIQDALLIKEPDSNRFSWWYDTENRVYRFTEPQEVDAAKKIKMSLRGNNWLYILPTRFANTRSNQTLLKSGVVNFLADHRNLGESVSRILWMQPVDFMPKLTIDLAEDISDVNPVVAEIFQAFESLLLPEANRQSTAALQNAGYRNEAIFEGPFLQHGWQQTSAQRINANGTMTLNLSQLFNRLLEIDGVTAIGSFSPGTLPADITAVEGDAWSWTVAHACYPRLWGKDPLALLSSDDSPLTLIIKGGILARPDEDTLTALLAEPGPIQTEDIVLPAGKLRDLAAYTPIGDRLPECYRMQYPNDVIDDTVRELHQFLLAADRLLADGCAELAALPQLLSFTNREKGNAIRGTRWPYGSDAVAQQVHQQYAAALIQYLQQDVSILDTKNSVQSLANFSRELDFIQYLLGYFGTSRAARPLTLDLADFLATERAYLAQQPSLGYDRINIRIDQVSALHKRIAARIGLNSECFADKPDLGKLPFYIIEHRQLLPQLPDTSYSTAQTPGAFVVDAPLVTLTQKGSSGKLVRGQLIELIAIEGGSEVHVGPLLIVATDGDTFTLSTDNSQQLLNDLERLQTAMDGGNLRWQNSETWLQDMDYRLNYAAEQPSDDNQRLLTSSDQSPYPAMVTVGDKIIIRSAGLQFSMPDDTEASRQVAANVEEDWQLEAVIKAADPLTNTLLIEKVEGNSNDFPAADDAWRYQWNFSEAGYATKDRFSFVVSIVHDRSMIEGDNIDGVRLLEWLQQAIMAEFPAHISLINLWLSPSEFKNFAATYKRWQNNGTPLGDDAFAIMQMLTLGHLPVSQLGIGLMRIATEAQRTEVLGADESEWNSDIILSEELFYVPQDVKA